MLVHLMQKQHGIQIIQNPSRTMKTLHIGSFILLLSDGVTSVDVILEETQTDVGAGWILSLIT